VGGPYWLCTEAYFARLATGSDDPQVWEALEKATKRAALGFRMELLNNFVDSRDTRHRAEVLRLLAGFLDDDAVRDTKSSDKYDGPCAGSQYQKFAVRDFVATKLASVLGIEIELNPERTPDKWAKIREKVRQAVDKELAKAK
jgi:hypothetical protein